MQRPGCGTSAAKRLAVVGQSSQVQDSEVFFCSWRPKNKKSILLVQPTSHIANAGIFGVTIVVDENSHWIHAQNASLKTRTAQIGANSTQPLRSSLIRLLSSHLHDIFCQESIVRDQNDDKRCHTVVYAFLILDNAADQNSSSFRLRMISSAIEHLN